MHAMCGRYVLDPATGKSVPQYSAEPMRRLRFAADHDLTGYDIRPTTLCAVVLPGNELTTARWGWSRDFATGGRIINARWETATEKRTFAQAVEQRRCVIPATGYYEWRRDDRDRPLEKYAFLPAVDGALLAMAGLYEDVTTPDGAERRFLVLTRPMARYAEIHDRTPVMLSEAGEEAWLDPTAPLSDVLDAASSMSDEDLTPRRVASGPTKARPAGTWLLEPVTKPLDWLTSTESGGEGRLP
jgi:putative SOS response-associated peptidase YedK